MKPAKRLLATPLLTSQVNLEHTANNSKRCANERLRAQSCGGGLKGRQEGIIARLARACKGSHFKPLYDYPSPGAPECRVTAIEHPRSRRAEMMCWPEPGENPAGKTNMPEDDTMAKRAAGLLPSKKQNKWDSGTWTWWTDRSETVDGRVEATVACLNCDCWTVFYSYCYEGA